MKNYIKTLMTGLFALTLMAGFAVDAHAQDANTAVITASANLQTEFEWDQTRNIVFGNVSKNNTAFISAEDGTSTNASIGQTGHAQLSGQASVTLNVAFPSVVTLAPGSGEDRIFLHLNVRQRDGAIDDDTFGGDAYTSGAELTFADPGVKTFFLGGTLSGADDNAETFIPTGHAGGEYTGTFTLTATYN